MPRNPLNERELRNYKTYIITDYKAHRDEASPL